MTTTSSSLAAEAEAAEEDDEEPTGHYHYLAIGSMMNPISVQNRKLNLEAHAPAQPGFLPDHKLSFYGSSGFAEAVYEKGAILHGVVYRGITASEMIRLDDIERDYQRKMVNVQLYPPYKNNNNQQANKGGSTVDICRDTAETTKTVLLENVGVYHRTDEEIERTKTQSLDEPPTERYLQILVDGATHYGVDPKYIAFLKNHSCRPRPNPSEYFAFCADSSPISEGWSDTLMTREQVQSTGNGRDGNPLCLISKGRVIQFCSDGGEADEAFIRSFSALCEQFHEDVGMLMSRLLYDPKWGIPRSHEEITEEHSAYTEHQLCEYFQGQHLYDKFHVVARIKD